MGGCEPDTATVASTGAEKCYLFKSPNKKYRTENQPAGHKLWLNAKEFEMGLRDFANRKELFCFAVKLGS